MDRLLTKEELLKLVEGLLPDHDVWMPHRDGKDYAFQRVAAPEEIAKDYENTVVSPKSIFFPSGEAVYRIVGGRPVAEEPSGKASVVVAIRPCDARALLLLDKVFGGEPQDYPYMSKRKNAVLLGLACNEPCPACFCTSVGGGPFSTDGLDVLMIDLGEGRYLLKGLDEKGDELISGAGTAADEASASRAASLEEVSRGKMRPELRIPGDLQTDEEYWRRRGQGCMDCGICAFVCPTCHCFDLVDEGEAKKRIWDTCTFPLFTRMTSGENPRQERRDRIRNRVYHKFSYFKEVHGEIACVGCGRCVARCPAGIDITELVCAEAAE